MMKGFTITVFFFPFMLKIYYFFRWFSSVFIGLQQQRTSSMIYELGIFYPPCPFCLQFSFFSHISNTENEFIPTNVSFHYQNYAFFGFSYLLDCICKPKHFLPITSSFSNILLCFFEIVFPLY